MKSAQQIKWIIIIIIIIITSTSFSGLLHLKKQVILEQPDCGLNQSHRGNYLMFDNYWIDD